MQLLINNTTADYAAFKTAVATLGTPIHVFYGVDPSSTNIDTAYAIYGNSDIKTPVVSYDSREGTTFTIPTQSQFTTDFPSAVNAYINSIASF